MMVLILDSLELDMVVKGGCVREVTRLKVALLREIKRKWLRDKNE
jgi:hypothetical protein